MSLPDGPLVAWYGDDFTGSAAVMEVLTFAGLPSVLFFDVPTQEQRQRFGDLRGIGIAGVSRAKSPAWMETNLPPVYEALRATGAPIVHYKVCSTFDSAPDVGSIGAAIHAAIDGFDWRTKFVPLIVAAPQIGRWQAFGNLFARAGEGVFRLDRHPTMSVHPVTPMHEADVCKHLEAQTGRPVGLVDFLALKNGTAAAVLERLAAENEVIAIDVVDEETLAAAGALVFAHADQMFAAGSQGLEYALVAHFQAQGILPAATQPPAVKACGRIAAVSGSCSPVTAEQIAHAEADGFAALPVDAAAAADEGAWQREEARAISAALKALSDGRDPILYSARGPQDGAIAAFREAANGNAEANERLGAGLGRILKQVVGTAGLTRAAIAGGDTSSAAAQELGLYAVTAEAAIAPGAALLRGHAQDAATDGLEIVLKGGQMGPPDFFERLRAGGPGGA